VLDRRCARHHPRSNGLILTGSEPYRLELTLVDGPVHPEEVEWADAIVWRSPDDFGASVLDDLLVLVRGLPEEVRAKADYIVPIAYSAFLFRDVIRATDATEWRPMRDAIVSYQGGDSIRLPMK
jgi:hypothetical protein